jgi:hypothetical protein
MSIRETACLLSRPIVAVPSLLALAAVLAITSFWNDSITCDEMSHLASGFSYLKTGDFRLSPDHPPLGRIWAALPLLLTDAKWLPPDTPGWREGDIWQIGPSWFYRNDGEHLLRASRCMMVILFLALCATTWAIARSLFGPGAGLLALILSALSPTLLAHGRLVTTDMPQTLFALLTLWTFAKLLRRTGVWRFLAFVGSLSALVLSKYSWPLVLPSLGIMLMAAVWSCRRDRQNAIAVGAVLESPPCSEVTPRPNCHRPVLTVLFGSLLVVAITWTAVWAGYLFRFSPFVGPDCDAAMMRGYPSAGKPMPSTMAEAWDSILRHWQDDNPVEGLTAGAIRLAERYHLLPQAYLYGLAYTLKTTEVRSSYLLGDFSMNGWRSYFPIAFAIKTTVPEMALVALGVAALLGGLRRTRLPRSREDLALVEDEQPTASRSLPPPTTANASPADRVLLIGLCSFAVIYSISAIAANVNIGHRHILPIYPVLFILAGAAVRWTASRSSRWFVGGMVVWQLLASLWIHPNYLSYFNELIGGPRNGDLYLADSNIDWGQDLKRLAAYSRAHPDEPIKLAYFGSADPTHYDFKPQFLIREPKKGDTPEQQSAELTAGTYCVSVSRLLGVWEPEIRESFWQDPRTIQAYESLYRTKSRPPSPPMDAAEQRKLKQAQYAFDMASRYRLVAQLRHRQPDDRICWSILVYRLTQPEIDRMIAP